MGFAPRHAHTHFRTRYRPLSCIIGVRDAGTPSPGRASCARVGAAASPSRCNLSQCPRRRTRNDRLRRGICSGSSRGAVCSAGHCDATPLCGKNGASACAARRGANASSLPCFSGRTLAPGEFTPMRLYRQVRKTLRYAFQVHEEHLVEDGRSTRLCRRCRSSAAGDPASHDEGVQYNERRFSVPLRESVPAKGRSIYDVKLGYIRDSHGSRRDTLCESLCRV